MGEVVGEVVGGAAGGMVGEAVRGSPIRASIGASAEDASGAGGRDGGRTRLLQRLFRARAEDALPLTVRHQRIYVLPTARGLAFLAALLLMLVASINYALSLGHALSFLLTGLFAATLLHTYRNLAGLEVLAARPGTAFAGEPLGFALELAERDGRERTGIRVAARDGGSATASLAAGNRSRVELEVPTARRGVRALGRLTLSSDWPLGLWRAWSYVHAPVAGLVWPAPEADAPPLPTGGRGDGDGARSAASDGDVAGLRAYEVGDAPSRVAWKSAARGTGLRVRLFDERGASARVVLNLEAANAHGTEARLSRLAAWVLEAERHGTDYALELPGLALGPDRGEARRHVALDALAHVGSEAS